MGKRITYKHYMLWKSKKNVTRNEKQRKRQRGKYNKAVRGRTHNGKQSGFSKIECACVVGAQCVRTRGQGSAAQDGGEDLPRLRAAPARCFSGRQVFRGVEFIDLVNRARALAEGMMSETTGKFCLSSERGEWEP